MKGDYAPGIGGSDAVSHMCVCCDVGVMGQKAGSSYESAESAAADTQTTSRASSKCHWLRAQSS